MQIVHGQKPNTNYTNAEKALQTAQQKVTDAQKQLDNANTALQDAKNKEAEAQKAYDQTVADSQAALQKEAAEQALQQAKDQLIKDEQNLTSYNANC